MKHETIYIVRGKHWKLKSLRNTLWNDHRIPCTLTPTDLRVTIKDNTELDYFTMYCRQLKLNYTQF